MIYFGCGNSSIRPFAHFNTALAIVSGKVFNEHLFSFPREMRLSNVSVAFARLYALASEREKQTVQNLLSNGTTLSSLPPTMSDSFAEAQKSLKEAEANVAAAKAVGLAGPAVSTLLVTYSQNFAAYIETFLIDWLGLSRLNLVKGLNSPWVKENKNIAFDLATQQLVVVNLIGKLLYSCNQAVVEVPARLFSNALFSLYSKEVPCFHRYSILNISENDTNTENNNLVQLLPPRGKTDSWKNAAMEVDGADAVAAVTAVEIAPTNCSMVPLKWSAMVDNTINPKIVLKLINKMIVRKTNFLYAV